MGRNKKLWEAAVYPVNVLNPYDSATGKLEKSSRYGFYSLVCGILDEQDTKITREDNKTDS